MRRNGKNKHSMACAKYVTSPESAQEPVGTLVLAACTAQLLLQRQRSASIPY